MAELPGVMLCLLPPAEEHDLSSNLAELLIDVTVCGSSWGKDIRPLVTRGLLRPDGLPTDLGEQVTDELLAYVYARA
jgi:hypothetical protein